MPKTSCDATLLRRRHLLIKVNRSATEASLYEATRFAWRVSLEKAKEAEVVLAVLQGLIVGAFVADDWLSATTANFPGRESEPTRFGFVGREASDQVKALYVNKRIPDRYRKRGAASPVRYTW